MPPRVVQCTIAYKALVRRVCLESLIGSSLHKANTQNGMCSVNMQGI